MKNRLKRIILGSYQLFMMMTLIGLSNPGKKYASTRHNAGKMLAGWLRVKGESGLDDFEILETDCYMNQSGEWLLSQVQNSKFLPRRQAGKVQSLVIAHDDLDLKLGEWKIQFATGPRLHKGILSIEQALGTKDFWRVRIGVDNRAKGQGPKAKGEEYVLRPFKREEKAILIKTFGLIKTALLEQFTI